MRKSNIILMAIVGALLLGNAVVLAEPSGSLFGGSERASLGGDRTLDKSASTAQYVAPNRTSCIALANRHERAEDRLASRNRLTRSNRRSADRREVRRARQRGRTQAQIRRLVRRNSSALRKLTARHRSLERALDRRNDAAARRVGCQGSTIDR